MAEGRVEYSDVVTSPDGTSYTARACGSERPDGKWQGWLEFLAIEDGEPIRSGRETTQPNRADTEDLGHRTDAGLPGGRPRARVETARQTAGT